MIILLNSVLMDLLEASSPPPDVIISPNFSDMSAFLQERVDLSQLINPKLCRTNTPLKIRLINSFVGFKFHHLKRDN